MGHIHRITPEYYADVRRSLRNKWRFTRFTKRHIRQVAELHGISYKTVMQIKNSDTFQDYKDQVLAQHPPEAVFSLAEHILDLHKLVFDKKDSTYHAPRTARTAIVQLEYELGKKATPTPTNDDDMWPVKQ